MPGKKSTQVPQRQQEFEVRVNQEALQVLPFGRFTPVNLEGHFYAIESIQRVNLSCKKVYCTHAFYEVGGGDSTINLELWQATGPISET